jgi:exopolysaccharide biosynthesis polyprenyl glycosylphosphotransferase
MTSVVPDRELSVDRGSASGQHPRLTSGFAPVPYPPSDVRWLRRLSRRLALLDAVVVTGSIALALGIAFGPTDPRISIVGELENLKPTSYLLLGPALAVAWSLSLHLTRTYDRRILGVGGDEYRRVARASVYFWGLVAVASYMTRFEFSRLTLGLSFVLGTVSLLLCRWIARKVLHQARRRSSKWSHRVLAVGGRNEVEALVAELEREPYAGLKVVGACMPPGDALHVTSVPVVGSLTSVPEAVSRLGVDTVAVTASRGLTSGVLKRLGWDLEGAGVELVVAPALTDVAGPRVHVRPVSGLQLLYVEQPEFSGPTRVMKEAFDRVIGLLGLLVLGPLIVLIAAAVRLTSQGPVIFRQVRVGRDGAMFTLYKFRTMVCNAEEMLPDVTEVNHGNGLLFKRHDDPRVTSVGRFLRRFSLDELPQLVNVLLGDMSMVGPRPALPSETEQYGRATSRRLLVKPGITGLWQVSGRSDLSWEDSVRLDLYYVENWSFAGDIQILWKTLHAVVSRRGAY